MMENPAAAAQQGRRKRGRHGDWEDNNAQRPTTTTTTSTKERQPKIKDPKSEAARLFGCTPKQVSPFKVANDPFNPGNSLEGWICRKEGSMGGALFITHVNRRRVEPQTIYGTPKLKYPYATKENNEWKTFSEACCHYYVATKWNGMNVLFFKYTDEDGNTYVTGKSKGSASLADGTFGNFFTSTLQVLGFDGGVPEGGLWKNLPARLALLANPLVQSLTFELCGNKEPHLVKYDFDLDLQPLFSTTVSGQISPIIVSPEEGGDVLHPFDQAEVVRVCKEYQERDFALNEEYRKAHGLKHKYEYNHFATEGHVLYLLDAKQHLIGRTMYKVKPRDIEEVHWGNFDATMEGRVKEAVAKIATREKPMTAASLRAELDMGPKEWGRYGSDVMNAVGQLRYQKFWAPPDNGPLGLLLVGIPASGKTTIAKRLAKRGWLRFSEDDYKGHVECKAHMLTTLSEMSEEGRPKDVVVDASVLNPVHRKGWISTLHAAGYWNVYALHLDISADVCKRRAASLHGEESDEGRSMQEAIGKLAQSAEAQPKAREGLQRIAAVHTDAEIEEFLASLS